VNLSNDPTLWIAGILIIMLYSFLYKENPFFRFAEHLYIGVGAGHALVVGFGNVRNQGWTPLVSGNMMMIIPLILGILLYTRFFKSIAWISRLCISIPIGLGIGLALRGLPAAQILSQIRATLVPLNSINNFILVFGVIGTLSYFFFTTKQTKLVRGLSEFGRWTMMVTFGITFGTAVFGQMSIYMGALYRVLDLWLGLVK